MRGFQALPEPFGVGFHASVPKVMVGDLQSVHPKPIRVEEAGLRARSASHLWPDLALIFTSRLIRLPKAGASPENEALSCYFLYLH